MKKQYKIIMCISIIVGLIILLFSGNKSNYEIEKHLGIHGRAFKEYAVFYPQHQDDEVLWGGSAIRQAISQCGAEKVFVVLVSDGSGVNVFKKKAYENLSRKEKEELRNKEFRASLKNLGVESKNIIILPDIDEKEGLHFELMEKVALDFEHKYKNVTHIAQSYKYDDHPMHRKNGDVIYNLYKNGEINDCMFFLKPKYINKVPIEKRAIYTASSYEDYKVIRSACMEYKIIDTTKQRRGIGYISAHSYFDKLLKDSSLTSILHLPY
ncbi:MAG: PIG-L family deacetylase [Peptostreptococcaceae bacterium]